MNRRTFLASTVALPLIGAMGVPALSATTQAARLTGPRIAGEVLKRRASFTVGAAEIDKYFFDYYERRVVFQFTLDTGETWRGRIVEITCEPSPNGKEAVWTVIVQEQ